METLFTFMEGPIGRGLRIVLGIVLMYLGLGRIGGFGGLTLAIAGLLPVAMGLWGPCLAHLALRRLRQA